MAEIIAGCHALEPDADAAQELRTAILALIPSHGTSLSANLYERAFWGLGVARSSLHRSTRPPEQGLNRRAELAALLSSALGVTIAGEANEDEQKSKSEVALSSLLFQHLISSAGKHPATAPPLHQFLLEHGHLPSTPEELEPLEASYLAALIPTAEEGWRDHQELLTRLVRSKNPLVTLRMADLLSRVSDRGLQSFLAEELVRQTGAKPRTSDPRDVARAVRQALGATGVSSAKSQEDRWEILQQEASAALEAPPPRDENRTELLKETVGLARLATLAAALSQGESGIPVFDELSAPKKKEEPPTEKDPFVEPKSSTAPRPRTLSNREKQQLEQYIAAMRAFRDEPPIVRAGALRQLAQVAPLVPDLTYEQAVAVARYLLAEKGEAEQTGIQTAVPSLKRWKQFRLAVADQLEESKLPEEQVLEVARALLDESAASLPHDRASYRRALLVGVLGDLTSGKESSAGVPAADETQAVRQAADELTESYRNRARLAGVAAADFLAAHSPAQALELLVQAMLKGSGGSPKDSSLLQKLEAARFLGTNDLKKTVLLQRLVIEVAVERVSVLRPRQAEAAALIAADLETDDAKAANLLVQLYRGEAALLKVGMLYGAN
jgi:hypothetical protein